MPTASVIMGRSYRYPILACRGRLVEIGGTRIEDTFAEAFRMRYVRLVVTAHDEHWLDAAVREFTGYSSSIISCDSETGVERPLAADETPDGRPGAAMLVFGFSRRVARRRRAQPRRPVPDDLPHHGRLRRPDRGRRANSAGQDTSAISATVFKRASSSAAAAIGAFR